MPGRPQRLAAVEAERAEGIGLREPLDREARYAGRHAEPLETAIAVAARLNEGIDLLLLYSLNQPEAQSHRWLRTLRGGFERAVPLAEIDIDLAHFDAMLARIADELCRR